MPRAAKRNNLETRLRGFKDSRSFVGLNGCDYLRGKDVAPRRREIYERAKGICQLNLEGCLGWVSEERGEWDHVISGLVGRCDCLGDGKTHGGRWVCQKCHRRRHGQL